MLPNLTNGTISDEERPGWQMTCPSCTKSFSYTILNIVEGEDVYLYCDTCSNFVLREEDRQELLANTDIDSEIDLKIEDIYNRLQNNLPPCECGGHFNLWSNVKCPHCRFQFPYDENSKNKNIRYRESKIVWVEGATAYRGSQLPSNKLLKVCS